ncbi:MAG: 30S ribosomal protein S17 [Patescibacteria group bacterium]
MDKKTETNKEIKRPRRLEGVVVSDRMQNTIVVEVSSYYKHDKYQKFIGKSKRYKADNPGNTKKEGDKVTIEECRPISKDKHFRVVSA